MLENTIAMDETFTQADLELLSFVFHNYKDINREDKESLIPVQELEKKITAATGGRYEPDTTYDWR